MKKRGVQNNIIIPIAVDVIDIPIRCRREHTQSQQLKPALFSFHWVFGSGRCTMIRERPPRYPCEVANCVLEERQDVVREFTG